MEVAAVLGLTDWTPRPHLTLRPDSPDDFRFGDARPLIVYRSRFGSSGPPDVPSAAGWTEMPHRQAYPSTAAECEGAPAGDVSTTRAPNSVRVKTCQTMFCFETAMRATSPT